MFYTVFHDKFSMLALLYQQLTTTVVSFSISGTVCRIIKQMSVKDTLQRDARFKKSLKITYINLNIYIFRIPLIGYTKAFYM